MNELAVGQVEDEEGEIGSSTEGHSLVLDLVQMGHVIARAKTITNRFYLSTLNKLHIILTNKLKEGSW